MSSSREGQCSDESLARFSAELDALLRSVPWFRETRRRRSGARYTHARTRAIDAINVATNGVFNRSLILSAAITSHCFTAATRGFSPNYPRTDPSTRQCRRARRFDKITFRWPAFSLLFAPLRSSPLRYACTRLCQRTLDPTVVRMRAGRHRRMEMRPLNGIVAVHYRGLLHGTCAPQGSRWAC